MYHVMMVVMRDNYRVIYVDGRFFVVVVYESDTNTAIIIRRKTNEKKPFRTRSEYLMLRGGRSAETSFSRRLCQQNRLVSVLN